MIERTYPRPVDPLVEENPFRAAPSAVARIPAFREIRSQLPVPIIPSRQDWIEMYWRAWEMAWSHLRRPRPENGFAATYIDPAFNGNIFMGDSAFMVQFGFYGRRAFDFMRTLDNFYAKQHDDGFICREIKAADGGDLFSPFDPDSTGPNLFAWAEWRYFRLTGDDSRLARVFHPLLAYHRWLRENRTWQSGLYWATGLSSGLDNQPRVPDSRRHHRHWTWVDTSMQAALDCTMLIQIARHIGSDSFVKELDAERQELRQLINSQLWNSDAAFYQDVDRTGRYSAVKSIAAYWGLLDRDMLDEKRWDPFVQHLRDSWAFRLPHRIPSQSADTEGYNANSGHYFRGGVWPALNFMVLKGLHTIGQHYLAHEIAVNHLNHVGEVYQHTDTFWENYGPESAAPGDPARSDFVGVTGLTPIAMLLEDVIGLEIDWPQRRITWHRHLDENGHYGVHHYPLGEDGTLDLLGNSELVVVTTDVPFTLTIRDRLQTVQTAVPAGTTELDLT